MVDFQNDATFKGTLNTEGELISEGGLIIGAGGAKVGDGGVSPSTWRAQTRIQVADTTERDAVVAWRSVNAPISSTDPLLVWRADGSSTGANEITFDGLNWYAESPVAGDIEMTMAATAPTGWLLLQGQLLSNAATNYPTLWEAADPVFRSGSSLRLPDLRGRVPMGAGTGVGLTLRNLGDALGAESVQLTEAQLASHRHDIGHDHEPFSTAAGGSHSHTIDLQVNTTDDSGSGVRVSDIDDTTGQGGTHYSASTSAAPSHTHSANVPVYSGDSGLTGSGQAHPNVQPSSVVNFKVKT